MKLIYKLLLLILAPIFLAMLAFIVIHGALGTEVLDLAFQRNAENVLLLQAARIDSKLAAVEGRLEALAATCPRDGTASVVEWLARVERSGASDVERYYYLSADGVVEDSRGVKFTLPDPALTPRLRAGARALTSLMKSGASGKPIMVFFAPVRDQDNTVIGGVGAAIELFATLSEVAQLEFGQTGFAVLAATSGIVISSERAVRSAVVYDQLVSRSALYALRYRFLLAHMREGQSGVTSYTVDGQPYVAHYLTLAQSGWKLAVVFGAAEAFQGSTALWHTAFFAPGLFLLFLLTIAYGTNRLVIRPLRSLITAQRRFGEGDFTARVKPSAPNEIGEVERTFNRMADQLETSLLEHRHADQALVESEKRYRSLVEMSPLPILVHRNGRFVYVNPAAVRLHAGTGPSDLLGRPLTDFVLPEHSVEFLSGDPVELSDEPKQFKLKLRRIDGVVIDVEATRIGVTYAGRPAVLTFCADITEAIRSDAEQRRLEQQVQHAEKQESLGILAGGIAHDFNNMLATILGNADLALLDIGDDSPAYTTVEQIKLAARRASELTSQMLAYSGKGRFVVRPVDLCHLVEDATHALEGVVSDSAVLRFELPDEPVWFEGDASQVRQVLFNLMTNASEALGEAPGRITIAVRKNHFDDAYLASGFFKEPPPAGCYGMLEVSDTGAGMDEETRQRIFDPFFTTKFTGRGLGLAAVIGIVRGHGGTIKVDSKIGTGTTFTVLFPYKEPLIPRRDSVFPRVAGWRGVGTVLVADDEPGVISVACRMLERHGFQVLTAGDGRQAIDVVRAHQNRVSCILLDMTMPDMTGGEVFTELLRLAPRIPVILCSGYTEQEVSKHFPEPGPAAFIHKPFGLERLIDTVRRVIETAEAIDRAPIPTLDR